MDIERRAKHHLAFYRLISGRNPIGSTGYDWGSRQTRHDLHFNRFGNYLGINQRTR